MESFQEHGGHRTAYDLYPSSKEGAPFALLIHGFAAHRGTLRGHAQGLARAGFVVINMDMSSLFSPSLEAAQLRNIGAAAAHVEWALALRSAGGAPLVDPRRVCLAGHSAGGAVALEATVELRRRGVAVERLCLLDGVPWPRTLGVAGGLLAPQGGAPPPRVLCIRSEPGAWNRRGLVLDALRAARRGGAGGDAAVPMTDAFLRGSGHGDPINPPQRRFLGKLLGLLGPPRCAELYAELLVAFFQAQEGEAFAAAGAAVVVSPV